MLVEYRLVLDVIQNQRCRALVLRVASFDHNIRQWYLTGETFIHNAHNGDIIYRLVPT